MVLTISWTGTQADRPNQKWLADFTYIWTAEEQQYVACVWTSSHGASSLVVHEGRPGCIAVMDALVMAVAARQDGRCFITRTPGITNRQVSTASGRHNEIYSSRQATCGIEPWSRHWSKYGEVSDGLFVAEDRTDSQDPTTKPVPAVFDYNLERFYNPRRRHSKLGYTSAPCKALCASLTCCPLKNGSRPSTTVSVGCTHY